MCGKLVCERVVCVCDKVVVCDKDVFEREVCERVVCVYNVVCVCLRAVCV